MRNILLIIGLVSINIANAQDTLMLSLDNSSPRVGDKVELSFSFDFFTRDFADQMSDDIIVSNSSSIFGAASDDFMRTLEFTQTGTQTIGPFKFDINGKTILTDSITIDVAKALPFKEGAWMRITSDPEGNKYLIIEQLIKNESNYAETDNGYTYSVGGEMNEKTEFAELGEIYEEGLSINFRQSKSNTRTNDDEDIFAPGLSYSYKRYHIETTDRFSGTFALKKSHFKNLPKKAYATDLVITK